MFRSSRVFQITALLALSIGAGTLLILAARYLKRKRREPSTGKSSSYNDRPLRRKRTVTSGKNEIIKFLNSSTSSIHLVAGDDLTEACLRLDLSEQPNQDMNYSITVCTSDIEPIY